MAGYTPPPRVKNALDNRKLNLSVQCPGTNPSDRAISSLVWGLYSNNPRITVYTNDPKDVGQANDNGRIIAALDGPVLFGFFAALKKIIDTPASAPPEERKMKIENKNYKFPNGKRSETPEPVSDLHCGKDDDGTIWISVTSSNKSRPRIKFPITPPAMFHRFLKGDGTPIENEEFCKLYASGYVDLIAGMMKNMMTDNFVEPETKRPNSGGDSGRGGYNNRGGNSRGGSYDESDSGGDADMPF